MMFRPRRKAAVCLSLACLAAGLIGAHTATQHGSVIGALCSGAAFLLFVILIVPVLMNQTVETGDGFIVVRDPLRTVQLGPDDLVEVVRRRDGSLAYRFHGGGYLHRQVTPLAYYRAGLLQEHFDRLFDLNELGVSVRDRSRQDPFRN